MQFSITSTIQHAGPIGLFVLFILTVFSLISWVVVIQKYLLLRTVRLDSEEFLDAFWSSKHLKEAHTIASEYDFSPQAAIFTAGFAELKKINSIRSRKEESGIEETLDMQVATMDNLKRTVRKEMNTKLAELSKNLPFLATTSSATPFIGLFGTVWGIMSSFHEIGQKGSATLATVAPGISEALVATAAGLGVAIPAVIFYNYFSARIDEVGAEAEEFCTDFLNLVERDLLSKLQRN